MDHIRILSIGLELACIGGKCGKIFSNASYCSSCPILRIRIWSILIGLANADANNVISP